MSKLVSVKSSLSFMQNGQVQNRNGISITFPSLETTGDLTLQSLFEIGLPKLKNITGHLDVSLTCLKNLTLTNLTLIMKSLSIYNNSYLSTLNFPNLVIVDISFFLISENPLLLSVSGFPNVKNIGGSISWTGTFSEISLPNINDVKGTVKIISSSSLTCPAFTKSRGIFYMFILSMLIYNISAIIQGANPVCMSSFDSDSGDKHRGKKGGSIKSIEDLNLIMIKVLCIITILRSII